VISGAAVQCSVLITPTEPTPSKANQFLDRALERIRKFMLALAILGLLVCAAVFRWPVAAGFGVGAIVSYVNHRWLERAVEAVGERITVGQSRERGRGIVFRAVLRYVFVAIGAYVIFNVSRAGLYGFLGGVCLPIAAIACEVAVELYVALRRGF
jgi:ATP synthase I chain